jgi:hypothetical protein
MASHRAERGEHMRAVDLRRVSDEGVHSAFTDLTHFQGYYYLTYRICPGGHMLFTSCRIVVRRSPDGQEWTKVLEAGVPDRDARDPRCLVLGERLAPYSGTWFVNPGDPHHKMWQATRSYMTASTDGVSWTPSTEIRHTEARYFWGPGNTTATTTYAQRTTIRCPLAERPC